jgi:hypothetical protein
MFTRFYFLNDSQFLDFMASVISNKDFNVYINLMFAGAQKLYVSRLMSSDPYDALGKSPAHKQEFSTAAEGADFSLQFEE